VRGAAAPGGRLGAAVRGGEEEKVILGGFRCRGAWRRRWGVVLGLGTPLPMGAGLRADEPEEGRVKPTR
jgi:hypothetical protein